uniref:Putative zinc finger protein n=1 Tax=Schistosoma mansoni TaxID=6183 RepID=A0A3Q0KP04_SCHMA
MNMISQPVLSSSTTGHGLSISDNFTTPIVSQPTLLNTVGLHDVNYEYLPYIFNSFLNPNNQHHHQNDCNNTPLNHQLIPNNSDILNLNALQIPIFKMIIANRNNKMNDSIINNNPMINMTHKNSENNSSFTNFSLTSSLTRAISSNTNSIGSQILPICTPLLQLAIRHALAECFPNNVQLHIQGRLEISMNTIDNNNNTTTTNSSNSSSTTLYFNDTYESPTKSSNFSNENKQEDNNNNNNPMCQKLINQQSTTSRRKPLNPSKCYPYDILYNNHYNNEQCENDNHISNNNNSNNFNLLHINQSTSPLLSTSSPTSPSSDSGVLDLSHGGSLADSAPITPLKEFQISHSLGISNDKHNSNNSNNITDDNHHYQYFNLHDQLEQYDLHCFNREQDILESYKKQLAAFNQIQAVWKMSTSSNSEKISNSSLKFDPKIKYSDNSNDKQKPNSEPNTPAKIGRRTRTNIGQTGRLTSIRRQSTNRRFPCNQCKEEFPSLHTLEQHTLSQHGTYRCHICQAQFTQRSNLQRHALKHVGFKPFECRVCSKAYYRKDHLMRHMEMGHPGFTPRDNITVHLTSSESLDYLTRSNSLVEFQSIPENYEQQEQQQQPMFTDETIIENEYYNDNEHENLDDTNLSPSPINKSHNVDSVYSPIKDEISLSLSEEQIKDSTQTTQ